MYTNLSLLIILLSMSNVTLQSMAIGIVPNDIATTMRLTCYLTDHSTRKKPLQKVQKLKKSLGIEPTTELVNHCFVYVVLTGMHHTCRDYLR